MTPAPEDHGNAAEELRAALERCALIDVSDLARVRSDGPDLLDLLNRLSTGKVAPLSAGSGATTVVTTSKGRIVARLFVHRQDEATVWMIGGTGQAGALIAHLDRYTFAERTGLQDRTEATRQWAVVGPGAAAALDSVGLVRPPALGLRATTIAGAEVLVVGHDGSSADGFSWIGPVERAAEVGEELRRAVRAAGGSAAGRRAREARRILLGLPEAGSELTEDANPLEAGLRDAVAFDKGCYVGQEVVARLNTYDKVSRELIGLRLPAGTTPPPPGTALFVEGREEGRVTSSILPPGSRSPIALAWLKRRASAPDVEIALGAADGPSGRWRVELPFPPTAVDS